MFRPLRGHSQNVKIHKNQNYNPNIIYGGQIVISVFGVTQCMSIIFFTKQYIYMSLNAIYIKVYIYIDTQHLVTNIVGLNGGGGGCGLLNSFWKINSFPCCVLSS